MYVCMYVYIHVYMCVCVRVCVSHNYVIKLVILFVLY